MTDQLSKVKEKIAALAAKTVSNGCSEAEAAMAMEKVGHLLEQYNLTMSEVQLRNEKMTEARVFDNGKRFTRMKFCVVAIANFCDCVVWSNRASNRNPKASYCFFGLEQDVMMAEFLYKTILSAMLNEAEKFKLTNVYYNAASHYGGRKRATVSFYQGFIDRINDRLGEMEETKAEKHESTGTDLIVLKGELIKKEAQKRGIRIKYTQKRISYGNYDAVSSGHSAAARVNLNRPVGGNSSDTKMIGGY